MIVYQGKLSFVLVLKGGLSFLVYRKLSLTGNGVDKMAISDKTTKRMKNRLNFCIFGGILLATVYVLIKLFDVAVNESSKYQDMANRQQFRSTTLTANRGTIYDVNGQVLAQSVTVYTVFVDPRTFSERDKGVKTVIETELPDGSTTKEEYDREESIVATLTKYLPVTSDEVRRKLYKDNAYQVIATEVDKMTADAIDEEMAHLKITSVGITPTAKRNYPQNDLASTVIGHQGYNDDGIFEGTYGLEKYYDDYLTGIDGKIITATDPHGAEFQYERKLNYDAKDGHSLYTNIDITIQYYLEKALETANKTHNPKDKSCAIVMNAKTGAIYAMATEPDYNPNHPREIYDEATELMLAGLESTVSDSDYNKAVGDARGLQWTNKAISSLYFPGSVFKVVTGSAALEENAISLINDRFYCNGSVKVASNVKPIKCWTTHGGHGTQDFVQAMTNSCNPAFVKIGQQLGAKLFCQYFDAFGFTEKTGIDLPYETNSWYAEYSQMTPLALATSSFGQTNKVTPLQMICAYAAVVNGGYLVTPYIVDKIVDCDGNIVKEFTPNIKRQVISEETSRIMRQTLETVVTVNSGSNAYIKGYHIGGKSGTSQKLDLNPKGDTYVSSYCAFYPADDPEIIMLVMVDEPRNGLYYGSAVAAPVVSEVLSNVLPYLGYYAEYTDDELESLEVKIPNVEGAEIESATATLKSLTLDYEIIGSGTAVVKQVPSRGNTMPRGCTVILYTDDNYEEHWVEVPDLTNMSLEKANKKLTSLGLNLRPLGGAAHKTGAQCSGTTNYQPGESVQKGTIIEAFFLINDETG